MEVSCITCGTTVTCSRRTRRFCSTRCNQKDQYRRRSVELGRRVKSSVGMRRVMVNEMKGAPCMDCKNSFPPVCMDFDHRPGEIKIKPVSVMVQRSYPVDVMLAEIAKCDLVCANCHRIRTFDRKKDI